MLGYTQENARREAQNAADTFGGRWAVVRRDCRFDFEKDDGSRYVRTKAVEYVEAKRSPTLIAEGFRT